MSLREVSFWMCSVQFVQQARKLGSQRSNKRQSRKKGGKGAKQEIESKLMDSALQSNIATRAKSPSKGKPKDVFNQFTTSGSKTRPMKVPCFGWPVARFLASFWKGSPFTSSNKGCPLFSHGQWAFEFLNCACNILYSNSQ